MTEKELVKHIQDRLDGATAIVERTSQYNKFEELEVKCLYEYLILQCNNTKHFAELLTMREWKGKELFRVYYLVYHSISSILQITRYEKDNFEYYDYMILDELLTDCLQTISGQVVLAQ